MTLSDEMIEVGVELNKVRNRMTDLDLEFEKLKKGLLLNENIDLLKSLEKFGSEKKNVVDELYKGGFISNDESDILNTHIWENRYRHKMSD